MYYESKFDIGDKVRTIYENEMRTGIIHAIIFTSGGCKYQVHLDGDDERRYTTLYETHLTAGDED